MMMPESCPTLDPTSARRRRAPNTSLLLSPKVHSTDRRSPTPATFDDMDYALFRQQEVMWLRQMHDYITKALPKDVFFDPTIEKANEAALLAVEADNAAEACMTTLQDKRSRRLARKATLGVSLRQEEGFPPCTGGDAATSAFSTVTPKGAPEATSSSKAPLPPPVSPTVLWGKALNGEMLRRVFTSVGRFRAKKDDKAVDLAARVVDRMLSLRRPRMLRCLLRSFLDDLMLLLEVMYPSLRRRRLSGFPHDLLSTHDAAADADAPAAANSPAPVGASPAIRSLARVKHHQSLPPAQPKPFFAALCKLSCHMGAIEDLIDAVVPPCDDTTFCGLQEFSERLNAMLAIEICKSQLIPSCCDALRLASSPVPAASRIIGDSVRIWNTVHEATSRLQQFISSHCDGDDDDDDEDSSSDADAPTTTRALDLEEGSATESNSLPTAWRPMLRNVAKDAKLFGAICDALSSQPPNDGDDASLWARRKRLAGMTLRCLTQDKEALRYLQSVCLRYPHVWDYILPSLVDSDLCLRQEVLDCVVAMLTNQDGDALYEGTQLQWVLMTMFQDRILACLDISAEALLPAANRASSRPGGFAFNSCRQTLALIAELLYALHPEKGATSVSLSHEQLEAFIHFHRSVLTLTVDRLEALTASQRGVASNAVHSKRQRDGSPISIVPLSTADLQNTWRPYQPIVAELLQHARQVVTYAKKDRHRAHFPTDVAPVASTPGEPLAAGPSKVISRDDAVTSSLMGRLYGSIRDVAKKWHTTGAQLMGAVDLRPSYPLLDQVLPAALRRRLMDVTDAVLQVHSSCYARPGTSSHQRNLLHGVCMELKGCMPTEA